LSTGGRLESWWDLCSERRGWWGRRTTRHRNRSPLLPSAPLPPEKRAEIEDLERAIREAIDAEISELAEGLAATDDAHLFGDNELKIRALAHRIAAKAIERHLAGKRTAPQALR
jgi:hypothetical protein